MSCCGDDIVKNQKSKLGEPECSNDCESNNVFCENIINSNCVQYTGATKTCLNIKPGNTLNQILDALEVKCLESSDANSTCLVKISEEDDCCGFLDDKITTGSDIVKTIDGNEGRTCQTLNLNLKQDSWTNNFEGIQFSGFLSGFEMGVPNAQYTKSINNSVKLRGTLKKINNNNNNTYVNLLVLPPGYRPGRTIYFSFTSIGVNNLGNYANTTVYTFRISTNGNIDVVFQTQGTISALAPSFISLDFIHFSL